MVGNDMLADIRARAKKIKLLLMDCDGVLTDGRLYFSAVGEELKVFHARDGQGIVDWHNTGSRSGVISGRNSPIVEMRMKQLGVEFIWQGRKEKVSALKEIIAAANVEPEEVAFIGDDTPDAEVFPLVGLAIAVGDAHEAVKAAAHYVTQKDGGSGAVRELIDMLMAAKI
ncbi:MAG: HAD hydrolase family protein [Chloracidobacterium sp.]|nr:HAD hydrolase family protein [Chloracidobacterium sp.]